ncbi:MAG: HEPN domain-containing protein [Planctomycetaceae bacterium]
MTSILTARDCQKAASQRLTTAEFLLEHDYTLDAYYLAGYAVECALKSLIMHLTPEKTRGAAFKRLKGVAQMHYPEHLKEELKQLNQPLPLELVRGFRRFEWTTALRYESGRRTRSEVRGYLKVVTLAIRWTEEVRG